MRYDYIIPVELKNYQPYMILYIYLISGYWAWFLSVVCANFYRLNRRHTMTESTQEESNIAWKLQLLIHGWGQKHETTVSEMQRNTCLGKDSVPFHSQCQGKL